MATTKPLRQEIMKSFVPLVEKHGFEVSRQRLPQFLEFRRRAHDVVHVFDIQWEKYGLPRFVVNFGTCPAAGFSANGKTIPAAEAVASWLPDAGRLLPGRGATTGNWFRQDRPLFRRLFGGGRLRPESEVVSELISLFGELETYWSTQSLGRHMRFTPPAKVRSAG